MGKRNRKNQHGKATSGSKKVKNEWKVRNIPQEHQMFREYYVQQLGLGQEDFQLFWGMMKEKLPTVFRVNCNFPRFWAFCDKIRDEEFIRSLISNEKEDPKVQGKQQQQEQEQEQKQKQQKVQSMEEERQIEQKKNEQQPQQNQLIKLQPIQWYPNLKTSVLFTLNANKTALKKDKTLSQFHKYIQKAFDSGLISRQQLVSMLPPLYLNVNPDDIILDMCAAPGSKTSQILEIMYGKRRWLAKGCVVANDFDYNRAQMLIHQLQRSGTAGMVVINHAGQFMPELNNSEQKQRFLFDKILCDVPCSGDGATRKIPLKWANWHSNDGMVLHPLQLSILMKAINILKNDDGYLVYSTCSLNPIENQSVINALFDKVQEGLEIVDIHPMFGVKGRRGMFNWKVLAVEESKEKVEQLQQNEEKTKKYLKKKFMRQYKNYEEVGNNPRIKESMFPPSEEKAKKIGLDRTMRILPHDQNSGGFYVALLRKMPNFKWNAQKDVKKEEQEKEVEQLEKQFLEKNMEKQNMAEQQEEELQIVSQEDEQKREKEEEQIQEQQKQPRNKQQPKITKIGKYQTFQNLNEEEFIIIQKFYGFDDSFRNLLYTRTNATLQKKVILVSEGVRKYLEADKNKKINLVNLGIQAFEKGKQTFAGSQCLYKLCQDSIHFLFDHMKQRKIKISYNFFKEILKNKSMSHDSDKVDDEHVKGEMRKMGQGSYCLYFEQQIDGEYILDMIVGQNYQGCFHNMASKEDIASLAMRYL